MNALQPKPYPVQSGLRALALSLVFASGLVWDNAQQVDDPSTPVPWQVWFNDPLKGFPKLDRLTSQGADLSRALFALLDSAQRTIDAAVYDLSDPAVIGALARACRRGVRVRIVTEAQSGTRRSPTFSRLATLPCITLRFDRNARLMHHKFAVIDDQVVWTGSLNWTCSGLYYDANDAVQIRDGPLARAFSLEFEQLWSGHDGWLKRDTIEDDFEIEGFPVNVYFSPPDAEKALRAILTELDRASMSIYLSVYAYTHDELHRALLTAVARGVRVWALWDEQGEGLSGSDVREMSRRGIGRFSALPGLLHHKFFVVDERLVITGSANWSKSAFSGNDENLLFMHDPRLAKLYADRLREIYRDAERYDVDPLQAPRVQVQSFWQPSQGVRLIWRPHYAAPVESYEVCRAVEPSGPCERVWIVSGGEAYFVDDTVRSGLTYYYRVRSAARGRWSGSSNEYVVYVRDGRAQPRLKCEL